MEKNDKLSEKFKKDDAVIRHLLQLDNSIVLRYRSDTGTCDFEFHWD